MNVERDDVQPRMRSFGSSTTRKSFLSERPKRSSEPEAAVFVVPCLEIVFASDVNAQAHGDLDG